MLPAGGKMVTCEIDPFLKEFTRPFFDASPHGSKIEVRIGSAIDTMRSFDINVRTPAPPPATHQPRPPRSRPADSSARLTLALALPARASLSSAARPSSAIPLGYTHTHPQPHACVSRGLPSPHA